MRLLAVLQPGNNGQKIDNSIAIIQKHDQKSTKILRLCNWDCFVLYHKGFKSQLSKPDFETLKLTKRL